MSEPACGRFDAGRIRPVCGPVAGPTRRCFHTQETAHRAVATAAAILQRLAITMAAVISNHQIDRLEPLRGVDETVPD
jgi:hypothetical protein